MLIDYGFTRSFVIMIMIFNVTDTAGSLVQIPHIMLCVIEMLHTNYKMH